MADKDISMSECKEWSVPEPWLADFNNADWFSPRELFLRCFMEGKSDRAMTDKERQWCVEQADYHGEGFYYYDELIALSDKDLAWAVLRAWAMYVSSM